MLECGNRQTDNSGEGDIAPFPIVETGNNLIDAPEGVHPFYKKYINADGVVIVGSENVSDAALIAARKTVLHIVSKRPNVHKALLQHNPIISIMAHSETASDLPEFGPGSDGEWGLGQMPGSPTTLTEMTSTLRSGSMPIIISMNIIPDLGCTIPSVKRDHARGLERNCGRTTRRFLKL
jgi:hypothetical protein